MSISIAIDKISSETIKLFFIFSFFTTDKINRRAKFLIEPVDFHVEEMNAI